MGRRSIGRRVRVGTVAVVAMLGLTGCGGGSSTPAVVDMTIAHDLAVYTGPTVKVSGTVTDYQSLLPLSGFKICLLDPIVTNLACATTGANGSYALSGVPAEKQVVFTAERSGYFPALGLTTTTKQNSDYYYTVFSTGTVVLLTAAAGQTADDTKGQFAIEFLNGAPAPDGGAADGGSAPMAQAGNKLSISPASGTGPFYLDANGVPSRTLMQSSTHGGVAVLNVDPGDLEVTIIPAPGVTCAATAGWPGSGANKFKVRSVAGHAAALAVNCM